MQGLATNGERALADREPLPQQTATSGAVGFVCEPAFKFNQISPQVGVEL
jgi:hypothetical protein